MPATSNPTPKERAAARKWLEHDHARHTLRGTPAQIADQHAKELERQHEHAQDIGLVGTAEELGQLPLHLKRHQTRRRRELGITAEHAARLREEYRSPRPEQAPAPVPPPAPRPSRGPVDRATHATASAVGDVVDSGWGSALSQMFIWGLGLSIGYLLITHNKAVDRLSVGATNIARAVVSSTVDPLNPKGHL